MPIDRRVEEKKSNAIPVPPGTHVGLFLGLIDLGVHKTDWKGVVKYKNQVLLSFELPDVTSEDGRPARLSHRVNYEQGAKANYMIAMKALNGGEDGVDLAELIGQPVMLQVKENQKGTGVNISGYMPVPSSYKKNLPKLVNEPKLLLNVEEIGKEELEKLPEWISKLINERVTDDVPPSEPDLEV